MGRRIQRIAACARTSIAIPACGDILTALNQEFWVEKEKALFATPDRAFLVLSLGFFGEREQGKSRARTVREYRAGCEQPVACGIVYSGRPDGAAFIGLQSTSSAGCERMVGVWLAASADGRI